MRRLLMWSLLAAALLGSGPVRGESLTPAQQNLAVATMAPTHDLFDAGALFEIPGTNLFSGSGTISDAGWQLSLTGMYQGTQVSLTYSGLNDPATGVVSWSGTGSFGASDWTTSGTATFAANGGILWRQEGTVGAGGGSSRGGYLKDGTGAGEILGGSIRILIFSDELLSRTSPPPPVVMPLRANGSLDQPPGPGPIPYQPYNFSGDIWRTVVVRNEMSLDQPKFEYVVQCIPEPSSFTLAGIGMLGVLICGWFRRRAAA
jgi:hypothetical protein